MKFVRLRRRACRNMSDDEWAKGSEWVHQRVHFDRVLESAYVTRVEGL